MACYKDVREYLQALEDNDKLVRIHPTTVTRAPAPGQYNMGNYRGQIKASTAWAVTQIISQICARTGINAEISCTKKPIEDSEIVHSHIVRLLYLVGTLCTSLDSSGKSS